MLIFISILKIFIFSYLTSYLYFFYGYIFSIKNYKSLYKLNTNLIENFSLLGIIYVAFFALIFNFFLPLNLALNTIFFILIFSLFFFNRKIFFDKKLIKFNFLISIISTMLLLYSNINRPDAALYHLPYVNTLNDYKVILGLKHIHFRFGHVSIIQYLSAINYNWLFGINGVTIPLAVIVSKFIFFFYRKILILNKKKLYDLNFYFCLFISIYIFYKINRYSSFGNDAITHLLFFYLLSLFLSGINEKNYNQLILVSVFIFLNKTTFIIVFLIPLYFFIKKKYFFNLIKLKKIIFSLPVLFLFLWIFKNILVSGCAVYPISKTCIEKFPWTDIKTTKKEEISGEAWSKGWPENKNPNYTMEKFNEDFNWLSSWNEKHLIKILKTIIPYLLILLSLNLYFSKKLKFYQKKNNDFYMALIITFLFTIIFFIKFPLYRYGYSFLISFLSLIFISNYESFDLKKVNKVVNILVIIFPLVFFAKQAEKFISRFDLNYINKPWPNIFSLNDNKLPKKKLVRQKFDLKIYESHGECAYGKAICTNYKVDPKLKIKKVKSYNIILR